MRAFQGRLQVPEKRRITEKLNEQFGISKLPYLLIRTVKERIRAFSGSLSKEEITILAQITNIEIIGLYLLKEEKNNTFRLSLDATHILKDKISKNLIALDDQQTLLWLKGNDLNIPANRGVVILKQNNDFLGCGISTGEKILNHVPKDRRLKK